MMPIIGTCTISPCSPTLSARTPRDAADALVTPIRQALACVTRANIAAGFEPQKEHSLFFYPESGRGVILSGDTPVRLRVLHLYWVTGEQDRQWSAHTTGYSYDIEMLEGHEVVAYHWDPREEIRGGTSRYRKPHLHVRGLTAPFPLSKAHFPTDFVSIQEVLLFAIRELGVHPLRPDAVDFLEVGAAQTRRW